MTHLLEKETPFVFSKYSIDAFQTLKKQAYRSSYLSCPGIGTYLLNSCVHASDFANCYYFGGTYHPGSPRSPHSLKDDEFVGIRVTSYCDSVTKQALRGRIDPKFSEDSRVRCFVPVHSSFLAFACHSRILQILKKTGSKSDKLENGILEYKELYRAERFAINGQNSTLVKFGQPTRRQNPKIIKTVPRS
ncbi:hypothetical protein Tco_0906980 [Tanacetum coccineum]|uniref:Uncharacterized protein n=1 Tax=Tanacetum coccineum TaxID=301880 RepID=A0ABQ5CIB1_9ASTR